MPDDPFSLFGLEPSLALDPDILESRFRETSKKWHPDSQTGDAGTFREIGAARIILSEASTRIPAALRALGLAEGGATGSENSISTLSEELMDLFAQLSPAIQKVEAVARKKTAARSELALALLAPEEIAARRPIEAAGKQIQSLMDLRLDLLNDLDRLIKTDDPHPAAKKAHQIARDCAFLERWQKQVRNTLLKLFN